MRTLRAFSFTAASLTAAALSAALIALIVIRPPHAFAADRPAPLQVSIIGSDGQVAGKATLSQRKNSVRISLHLANIPTGLHAIHIHSVGKCDAPDFKTAGSHYNPAGKKHGMRNPDGPHAGDLPLNLEVTPSHTLDQTVDVKGLTLDELTANGGTAIVIHEHADDFVTDPSGNSGNRIACGVIAAANQP